MSSPDVEYTAKHRMLQAIRHQVRRGCSNQVLLYQDEVTYYSEPSTAKVYGPEGSQQPTASHRPSDQRKARIAGAMEVETGKVEYLQSGTLGRKELITFYEQLTEAWPDKRLYVVQDNWPVHFHPEVMQKLESQTSPWEFWIPDNWSDNKKAVEHDGPLPIQIVRLPTYAPWLNPIEKLWRWLKQKVIHMHELASNWTKLKGKVASFLNGFQTGSRELLEYTGLLPE